MEECAEIFRRRGEVKALPVEKKKGSNSDNVALGIEDGGTARAFRNRS
jgi:hypothetical protein